MTSTEMVRLSGLMLDREGYRTQPAVTHLDAHVLSDGRLYEDWYGSPFEQISLDVEGNLTICGGTFIPDAGELGRLSRNHGCKL
jgi:hypothetical protein